MKSAADGLYLKLKVISCGGWRLLWLYGRDEVKGEVILYALVIQRLSVACVLLGHCLF